MSDAMDPTTLAVTLHTGEGPTNLQIVLQFLEKNPEVEHFHYHWTDLSGVLRVRIIPKTHCLRLVGAHRPLRAGAFSLIGFVQSSTLPKNFRAGGVNSMWPDWRSIRVIYPGHASVFCNVSEEAAGHTDVNLASPFQRCPRSMLQSLLRKIEVEHHISFLTGFELEFYLMSKDDREQALEDSAPRGYNYWSSASGMRDPRGKCLEECVKAVQAAGIYVEQFHAEPARYMYEISTGPLPVLSAIDTWNQTLEIVKRTAINHGYQATFLPKPFSTLYCLGQHAHLSVHADDLPDEEMENVRDAFLAGILRRLPLLCGYGMPCQDSFKRHTLAFAGWVAYGTENRGAPIRKVKEGHWELKTIDATANFYLVLAAFIASGILGIREKEPLVWTDIRDSLSNLDDERRERLGIHTPLPSTLEEALRLCKSDHMGLDEVLGKQLLSFFTVVKEGEARYLANMTEKERKLMYLDSF